jgi:hypothetical protein
MLFDALRAVLLAALMMLALLGPFPVAGQVQLEGEYGLWVTDSGGGLGVGWLLSRRGEGVLEVLSEGRIVHQVEGQSERPAGAVLTH